jgi:hypothetical protein
MRPSLPDEVREMTKKVEDNSVNYKKYAILKRYTNEEISMQVVSQMLRRNDSLSVPEILLSNLAYGYNLNAKIDTLGKVTGKYFSINQKNLFSLMFELPSKPVSIGDVWELNLHFTGDNTGFKHIDNEEINRVKFVDVKSVNNSLIAVLEYDIYTEGKGELEMLYSDDIAEVEISVAFKAKMEFNITKGKWNKFKGTIIYKQTGFFETETKQDIELIEIKEIPKELDNIANLKANKSQVKVNNKEKDFVIKKTFNNNKNSSGQPFVFRVQVLASKNRIHLPSPIFEKISDTITEVIKPNEEFKYKYLVGKEYTIENAQILKHKLNKIGFEGAFITKTRNN